MATDFQRPPDHPQRLQLNNEVHARPPEALSAPTRIIYLALASDWSLRERQWRQVCDLAALFDVAPPPAGANHFSADLGAFRVAWERHTEFTRYTFIFSSIDESPFTESPLAALPADWLVALPGKVMAAAQVALLQGNAQLDIDGTATKLFGGNGLVGSAIAEGAGTALTDFRIHADGFSRFLVLDHDMTQRQAGRMVQRLLEIDTYRLMALLALPVALELSPFLGERETALASITAQLANAGATTETELLHRLTRLEAEISERAAESHYRFSAAAAYYRLVESRILELREERIRGLQTFGEFTERRLAPAMNTCRAVSGRLDSLSQRVARTTQLLATRVAVAREGQNQALLESMNRRAQLQLRLQQTVEGLSVAAVTYYVVGLIGYAAKALKASGVAIDPDLAMGASAPVVLLLMAVGAWRLRRHVTGAAE